MFVDPGALLAIATIWIELQNRRIRSWQNAAGRIDSSKPVAREIRTHQTTTTGSRGDTDFVTEETIETRNFAEISYSFAIGPTTYHGTRIGLAPDPGNFEVAETLQRYPQGKAVTVVYNPIKPNECILERDDPSNIRKAWLAVAVLVALIVAGFVAITQGADRLAGIIANPAITPLVMVLAVFALAMMLFARVAGKQARETKAWPKTQGRITRSEVETTVQQPRRTGLRQDYDVTMYVPRVIYAYQVDGHAFEGDNVGWSGSASTPAFAEKYLKRFALQTPVEVFYNPLVPTQSTLAGGPSVCCGAVDDRRCVDRRRRCGRVVYAAILDIEIRTATLPIQPAPGPGSARRFQFSQRRIPRSRVCEGQDRGVLDAARYRTAIFSHGISGRCHRQTGSKT
jgi:hypothetical protein